MKGDDPTTSRVPVKELSIDMLLREKEELSRQVKRLIKAEGKLYDYQQELDVQLKEYKELYELNRRLSGTFDIENIFRETVTYVVQHLEYERAVFLRRSEASQSYLACALDGYYDPAEVGLVAELEIAHDTPCLSPLSAGAEYLICTADSHLQALVELRARLLLNEYLIYPLGSHSYPHALLVVGNSADNAVFHRRVTESRGSPLSMGNLAGLVSSLIANQILLEKRERAREEAKRAEEKYRQLSEVLEQRVREAVDELRQKDKIMILQGRQAVMGEMLSNIAHQWRQPLNMVALLVQDLQMTSKMQGLSEAFIDSTVKRTLEVISQMSKTIDDFRYFFRPDKEKVEFPVAEIIEKTLSLLQGSFNIHGIRTEVAQTGHPVINGYPTEFVQVLLNILINARDALTANHTLHPLVSIKLFTEGGKTVVSISDNAGGVPEEIRDKIFEPYFTTKGPEQGTGIGLFMCKTIIEKNMQGVLTVRNVGDGAEFRIEI